MSVDACAYAHDAMGRVLVLYTERLTFVGDDEATLYDVDVPGFPKDRALVFHRHHADAPYWYRDGSGELRLEDLEAGDRAAAERFVLRADAATVCTFPATALERGRADPADRLAAPPPAPPASSSAVDAGAVRRSMAERLAAAGWYARMDRAACPRTWWELAGPDETAPGPFPSSPRRALAGAQVTEVTDRVVDTAGRLRSFALDRGWKQPRWGRLELEVVAVLVAAAGSSDDPEVRSRAQEARRTLVEDQRLRWHLVWSFAPMLEASLATLIAEGPPVPRALAVRAGRRGILKMARAWDERRRTSSFFELAESYARSEIRFLWDAVHRGRRPLPELPDLSSAPAEADVKVHGLEVALDSMPASWLQALSGDGDEDAVGWLTADL